MTNYTETIKWYNVMLHQTEQLLKEALTIGNTLNKQKDRGF